MPLEHSEGSAAANRYSVTVTPGEFPGSLSVGTVAGTRMACPEEVAAVEARFLSLLKHADRFGWQAGHLWISYRTPDVVGMMLFRRAGPSG